MLQNLHTHSIFCDGADTPEAMVLSAIEKGLCSLGFSSHSYARFSRIPLEAMKPPRDGEYRAEIKRLKEKYKSELDIFCGIELEAYSDVDVSDYDYVIGSVHYLKIGDKYVDFDGGSDLVKEIIDTHFGGDGMEYALAYFRTVTEMLKVVPERKIDIIGHFDLITKHADSVAFFDEDAEVYRRAACEALDALAGRIPYFEVNTGAMPRYGRSVPYPSAFLLGEMKKRGLKPIITSDCHSARNIDFGYDIAKRVLREAGFSEQYILTREGFCAVAL